MTPATPPPSLALPLGMFSATERRSLLLAAEELTDMQQRVKEPLEHDE
jgi:hypothetical protein